MVPQNLGTALRLWSATALPLHSLHSTENYRPRPLEGDWKKKKKTKRMFYHHKLQSSKNQKKKKVQVEIRPSCWSRRWAQEGALGQRPGGFRRGAAGRRRLRKQNAGRAPPEVEERRTGNYLNYCALSYFQKPAPTVATGTPGERSTFAESR